MTRAAPRRSDVQSGRSSRPAHSGGGGDRGPEVPGGEKQQIGSTDPTFFLLPTLPPLIPPTHRLGAGVGRSRPRTTCDRGVADTNAPWVSDDHSEPHAGKTYRPGRDKPGRAPPPFHPSIPPSLILRPSSSGASACWCRRDRWVIERGRRRGRRRWPNICSSHDGHDPMQTCTAMPGVEKSGRSARRGCGSLNGGWRALARVARFRAPRSCAAVVRAKTRGGSRRTAATNGGFEAARTGWRRKVDESPRGAPPPPWGTEPGLTGKYMKGFPTRRRSHIGRRAGRTVG